jgi:16S rRNA (uracil1498-N3)-methyltransferase
MNARFYAPAARAPGELIALPSDEAEHLTRVLRLAAGSAVRVFDGRGHEFDASVEHIAKRDVSVRVGAPRAAAPEPRVAITLAQAALKGDRMDDVVRDAVMLGVAAIQPIVTDRTEVSLAALERGRRRERWERIAVSSTKQCGRAVVPPVMSPISFDALVARRAADATAPLLCVEPSAAGAATPISSLNIAATDVTLVIGPEGGWSAAEIDKAGKWQRVTLGARTLRAETVPVIAIAALFTRWKEF